MTVQVKPRAPRNGAQGVRDGALVFAVTAAPVDGEANDALVRALSGALDVPARSVTVVSGQSSRRKLVDVLLDAAEVRARLSKRAT